MRRCGEGTVGVPRVHLVMLMLLLAGGCRGGQAEVGEAAEPALPSDFSVRDDDPELVFQYFSAGGELKVATSLEAVPAAAREHVIVLSRSLPKGALPASSVIVADLRAKGEDGSYPFRLASRYSAAPSGRAEPSARVAAPAAADKVLLFTTRWCPHCRTARRWLEQQGIPFEEKDVEQDAAAQRLLMQLGQAQGLAPSMLSSVPILHVRGKLVLGFNQQEVARLLGLR